MFLKDVNCVKDLISKTSSLKENIQSELKKHRIGHSKLQSKYENMSVWVKMFSKLSSKLKNELVRCETANRANLETVAEYIDLQIHKDKQEEIDKNKISLIGESTQSSSKARTTKGIANPDGGDLVEID
jgi:hypothetical protein